MTDTLTQTTAPLPAEPDAPTRAPRTRRRPGGGNGGTNWWLTALIAVCSLTVLIPLYFTVVTALKTPDQLGGTGFELPTSIRWENFADAYQLTNFPGRC